MSMAQDGRRDEVMDSIVLRFADRTTVGLGEAASILGMSTKTLSRHIMRREIRYFQIGFGKTKKRRTFTARDLASFVERRKLLETSKYPVFVPGNRGSSKRR